ncbi:hypothetical protein S40285_10821, partial [Stachybotrys chlorohalonatus IBT 40285]
MAPQL